MPHPHLSSAELLGRLASLRRQWAAERNALTAALAAVKNEWAVRLAGSPASACSAASPISSPEHGADPGRPFTTGVPACHPDAAYERLQGRLCLQGLLAEVSTQFLASPQEEMPRGAGAVPMEIVCTLGLDRMTLWQHDEGLSSITATHCWHVPDGSAVPARFPMETILPWTHAMIQSRRDVVISSLAELPQEAARDAETFRLLGCCSHVTMPLPGSKGVFGALSFDTVRHPHRWTWDEIAELKLVAQTIGNVIGRQRAEAKADQLRRELAHTMRVASLGGLAEGLAHELHQPLAAILANAQAARRFLAGSGIDPEELRAILDDIVRDDKRAGGVIHNLRAMVSKNPGVREHCSINDIVGEVLKLLHAELQSEHVEVRAMLALDLPSTDAARVELQQVILNLLVNAVQAMKGTAERDRVLEVSTRLEGSRVVLCVRDRGHGIPPERLARVFEPFFSSKVDGLGLGLSICRTIIENHGGHIQAQNRSGGGAEFTAALPALPKPVER